MTITNHILAGSIIGLTVSNPVLAIVLALTSHFIMDALPHFGYAGQKGYGEALQHRMSYIVAVATAITSVIVIILLALNSKWFAIFTGIVAASPDAAGVYNWLKYEKQGRASTGFIYWTHVRFHRAIQKFERPWGIYIEVLVTVCLGFTVIKLLYA